jgi:hypothetical protein
LPQGRNHGQGRLKQTWDEFQLGHGSCNFIEWNENGECPTMADLAKELMIKGMLSNG